MEDGDYDYQSAYQRMIAAKECHRTLDQIVDDLKKELIHITEESFLVHAMRMFVELDFRTTSPLYKHLQSPMRQTLYLIDVYYSIEKREESIIIDDECWDRIAVLLDEIEMTYFLEIGFPNNGDLYNDERDEKIDVPLATFLGYFGNAVLNYEEQTIDRIMRFIKPYDKRIQEFYGFTIEEAIKFISHMRALTNDKLNTIFQPYAAQNSFYVTHPEEWRKLTRIFEERGIRNPRDWANQPELSCITNAMTTNPGEIFIHEAEELKNVEIDIDSLQHIIEFFSCDKNTIRGKNIYYAAERYSESHPLIQIGDKYACPISKFLYEGLYYRLDKKLSSEINKYKQGKDFAFEKKVTDVFQHFFPKKGTKFFTNYCVDGVSENDLLIILSDICIIVEIKDCNFREPFRNPLLAYDRIKTDFKKAIQEGYKQCRRIEKIILTGQDVDICDADNKTKVLYHLRTRNIHIVKSIVVTDYKYGAIQTDLSKLLEKEDDALYPWSVCIDDLESFFLLMKKRLQAIALTRFIEFLEYRERLQGHVICFDELEICGWYLNSREQFKECADKGILIQTTPNMGTIFDAYYRVGLGFENELDIKYKERREIQDYPRKFEMFEIPAENVNN